MNDDLNEFERLARARLQRELGRVSVPAGRTMRARPRSSGSWGRRLAGGSAALAMLVLVTMVVASGLRVAPETAQAPTQTAQAPQTAGGAAPERLILLSTTRSTAIIRAIDPATRQVLWESQSQDQTAAASLGGATPIPAWIDGAVSPDGSRVFVTTREGLVAYDAATGQSVWATDPASAEQIVRNVPGRPSALAVAADGQRLYIQKETGQGRRLQRWLDVVDAVSGESQGRIELPQYGGVAQVFALADQIYCVTAGQVLMAEPGGQSFDRTRTVAIPGVVHAASPARDGRSIYVSNDEILLNIDRTGLTTPLPPKYQTVNAPKIDPQVLEDLLNNPNTIIDTVTIDPEDPRLWTNDPLALSPDGKTAAAWVSGYGSEPARLKLYDLASWKPIAMFADPGTSKDDWLRGDTLQFNPSGTAIYAIAGPLGYGGGDSALVSMNVTGGGVTRLIELPGETVAGLLLAAPPAPAVAAPAAEATPTAPPLPDLPNFIPDRIGPAGEPPPIDPSMPNAQPLPGAIVVGPPVQRLPPIREQAGRIPLPGRPLVPAGEIGWLLQAGSLTSWDRDGSTTRPIGDSAVAAVRWAVPRPKKRPLLLVGLDDGRDAVLDPESDRVTPLDLPGASVAPPVLLSPDGAQLVFKRSAPGQPDALAQADLATGATWTLIDAAALGDNWTWLDDGRLAGWGADGIYLDVEAPASHSLLRIQPRTSAADPARPQFETLLDMADGGWLSLSPASGLVAYRRIGEPALYLLDTRSGQEQPATTIDNGFFALSPDGGQLAYVQPDSGDTYSLRIYSPPNQSGGAVTVGLGSEYSLYFNLRWSADGRYLIVLSGRGPTQIQVFDTRSMVYDPDEPYALMAKYALPGDVSDVAVQQVMFGSDRLINVVTVSGGGDGGELNIYNPLDSTRQTFELGGELADLVFVP